MKQPVTILQSMRAGLFAEITVTGSQYRDTRGTLHWYFAVCSEQKPKVRIYRVSGGALPPGLDSEVKRALTEAKDLWEGSPASRLN
jgi:hypothetical protein